jgi:hypothetical protein
MNEQEQAIMKSVINGCIESGLELANYLCGDEARSFIDELVEFHWNEDIAEEDVQDGIHEMIVAIETMDATETLAVIAKYVGEPKHIYIDVLKFYASLAKMEGVA